MIKPVKLFDLNMGQLPTKLPLLPLGEMVLMPEGKFSIRLTDYRQIMMIFKALANGRMLAVVLQKSDGKKFSKGCAARICSFTENDDDSLTISLLGVCRFAVLNEVILDNYPFVEVDYKPFAFDMTPSNDIDKKKLLYFLDIYLKTKHIDIDVELLEKLSARRLLATLASVLPLDINEKQALLECADIYQCVQTLQTILKMGAAFTDDENGGRKC